MFLVEYKTLSWWYWLATAMLLTLGIFMQSQAFEWAIYLTIIQLGHFSIREANLSAFPVQVRFWYLMLLLLALPEKMQLIYWIPMVGTWAQLFFGYCTMARLVSLFPWNRSQPMTWQLLKITFFSAPAPGNIMQGLSATTKQ